MTAAEGRHERKQRTQRKEGDPGHYRHMIAGDREDVGETRHVHGLVHRRRDGVAFTGDERRGNRTLSPGRIVRIRLSMASRMPSTNAA